MSSMPVVLGVILNNCFRSIEITIQLQVLSVHALSSQFLYMCKEKAPIYKLSHSKALKTRKFVVTTM